MSIASRVKPETYFTPQEWERLNNRTSFMGIGMVMHAWAVIALAMAIVATWTNVITVVLACMIIGGRQLGLAILMHEAAHMGLSPHKRLNDWVGQWLCGAPVGASLADYRAYHLQHHKYAQQEQDPDLILSSAFPTTRSSLARKIFRDLSGQTFFKQRLAQFTSAFGKTPSGAPGRENLSLAAKRSVWPFLLFNLGLLAALTALGFWQLFILCWLLPMATWYPLATRLRNIGEHAVLENGDSALGLARTTLSDPITSFLVAPYWVNYHLEHHMFMYVPFYNLRLAHRILREKGITRDMEIGQSYYQVLAKAASLPEPVTT